MLIEYRCTLPAAGPGCRTRRVRIRSGRHVQTLRAPLEAGEFRFTATPEAVAHVLEIDANRSCTRGPRLALQWDRPPATTAAAAESPATTTVDVRRLRKDQLIALAEERGIGMTGTETKDELIALLTRGN